MLEIGVRPNHPAVALARITERIASLFGELVYLAGTWSESKGRYEERQLTAEFSGTEVTAALHRMHRKVFADWLALGLREQASELQQYLDEVSENRRPQTLRFWMQDRWCERLVPKDARQYERLLFISDLDILLPLVYRDISGEVYE